MKVTPRGGIEPNWHEVALKLRREKKAIERELAKEREKNAVMVETLKGWKRPLGLAHGLGAKVCPAELLRGIDEALAKIAAIEKGENSDD